MCVFVANLRVLCEFFGVLVTDEGSGPCVCVFRNKRLVGGFSFRDLVEDVPESFPGMAFGAVRRQS